MKSLKELLHRNEQEERDYDAIKRQREKVAVERRLKSLQMELDVIRRSGK